MDPLSVTLAVVSLATAVKDLVELGRKIHESFAKVSKNLRNARRVAGNIKEMLDEINTFCEGHKDVLANMKDFCVALQGLLVKFRGFEASILPLLPKTGRRKLGPFIRGWWNNNKIQDSISDLESDIVKVMRGYMMNNAMRTEVKLETMHQDTSKGLVDVRKGMTQGFEVIRRDISALRETTATTTMTRRSYESESGATSDEFERNIIMFAQSTLSTSVPMLRTPNVITEELMTAAYIKLQINTVAVIVENMPILPAFATTNVESFQLATLLEHTSMRITHLRHHVVRQVITIRDLLDTPGIHTVSIRKGTSALNNLSLALKTLGMGHESILLGNWAITLMRALLHAADGGHPDRRACLALYLCNQSTRYDESGDKMQSLQFIEEAHAITQDLQNQFHEKTHFQILHSKVLLQYAKSVDNQQSIKMAVKAIQILEDILNIQAFTLANGEIQSVVQLTSSFFDRLFFSAPPITVITNYAVCLATLAHFIRKHHLSMGGYQKVLALVRLAIALHQKLVTIHGHVHKAGLADALLLLVRLKAASFAPGEDFVDIANECIHLFRDLADNNPLYYARKLVDALWAKATTLQYLGQYTEAIATWEEVASLARQIVQDSALCARALGHLSDQFRRLKRHDDAVRTGKLAITTYHEKDETRAERYFYLTKDLLQLRRYKESAEAARTTVALYRRLATRDPRKWMMNLTEGLSALAHCLVALGDNSEGLLAWTESVSMLDNFLLTHASNGATLAPTRRYRAALIIHRQTSLILEDKEDCFKVCSTIVRCFRQLLEICPWNRYTTLDLFWAEICYAYNMLRVGHIQEAQQYIDNCLDIWSMKQEATIPLSQVKAASAAMTILKADVLDAQGCTKQALLTTQTVRGIVKLSISTSKDCFLEMIDSMHHEAQLHWNLGNSGTALEVAKEALQLARDNKLKPIVDNLVSSLHAVALAALSCGDYNHAVEAAQEGCDILAGPEGSEFGQDHKYRTFMRPSLFAILSSAEANLGRRSTALDCAHRAVDASLEFGRMKAEVPATAAERSYMETRGNLAEILLTTGDLAQARQICEEGSAYFFKRVEIRMGEYRNLAPILRMLGVLCCSEGRHEEGEAAAKELSRIMKTLGSTFPSLQEQVKIRLRNQAKVPILKVLDDMSQKLDCRHQTEVVSLFAI
ncbi:hypothetical protein D9619_009140 [Psilocybe cf. subviscida]|uniref:Uncharacterized protein n=1 Tax=Psilocybe cf. subviscida TaxID=2480587 RepID=A0A8H5FAN0_9AGAR|nr:hypothetical protein D9619_009140 [Psilocybe cf. subviscida]